MVIAPEILIKLQLLIFLSFITLASQTKAYFYFLALARPSSIESTKQDGSFLIMSAAVEERALMILGYAVPLTEPILYPLRNVSSSPLNGNFVTVEKETSFAEKLVMRTTAKRKLVRSTILVDMLFGSSHEPWPTSDPIIIVNEF